MFTTNNYHVSIELEYPVRALSKSSACVLSGVICNGLVMNQKSIATVKIYQDYIDFGPSKSGRDGQVFFNYHIVGGRLIYKLTAYSLSYNGTLEYTLGSESEPDDYKVYQLLKKYEV